jgi:ABC-type transporter Mla subunit MlaD
VRAHGGHRISNWVIGLVFIVFVIVGTLWAFVKEVPWSSSYEVKALFASASNVRVDAPVRIAGVNVGKVTGVEHLTPAAAAEFAGGEGAEAEEDTGAAVVTMEITDEGRPLKTDATFQLRPRLFLEGNLFVQLQPGSPQQTEAGDGYVFGIDQTSTSVQLDQILTTLQADVRDQLQIALEEFGSALIDHGGAEGFREFYRTSAGAFKYSSQVEAALLGTEPHDLSNMIRNLDKVVAALGRHEVQLKDLVTNFRIFAGSFAAEQVALAEAVALLPGALEAADPAFTNLNAAFPPLRAFANELLPGVETTPATLEVATPFIEQLAALVAPDELGGLVTDLETAVPSLAELTEQTPPFLDQARALSSCFNEVIVPWSNDRVDPPANYPLPVAGKVFEETGYGLAGISGESRSGDANGQYIRTEAGGGVNLVHTGSNLPSLPNTLFGLTPFPLEGGVPSFAPYEDSAKPLFKPEVPCERQDPPNLGASLGAPPEQSTVAAPSADNLPTGLADAYTEFTTLLNDLGKVVQLEADGKKAKATRLEDATNEAIMDLYDTYGGVIESLTGAAPESTSTAPTGGITAEEGG